MAPAGILVKSSPAGLSGPSIAPVRIEHGSHEISSSYTESRFSCRLCVHRLIRGLPKVAISTTTVSRPSATGASTISRPTRTTAEIPAPALPNANIHRCFRHWRKAIKLTAANVNRKARLAASTNIDSDPTTASRVPVAPMSNTGRSGTPFSFRWHKAGGSSRSSATSCIRRAVAKSVAFIAEAVEFEKRRFPHAS